MVRSPPYSIFLKERELSKYGIVVLPVLFPPEVNNQSSEWLLYPTPLPGFVNSHILKEVAILRKEKKG